MTIRTPTLLCALGTTALLGACSSAPNQNLISAQQTYEAAAQNPAVVRDAPLDLQQAKASLDRAEALAKNGENSADVDYYAYLATRDAQTAQQSARLREAQDTVKNAGSARAEALLQTQKQQTAAAQQQAQSAEQRAHQLQQQLAELRSNQASTGMVMTLGSDILFDVGGAQLKPGALSTIQQVATYLKQHPDRSLTVDGFTDNTGSASYNLQLSRLRADAVRTALVQDGVPADRIVTKGFGETSPVASNATAGGRQLNRRVQLAISGPNGAAPAASAGSSLPPGSSTAAAPNAAGGGR